MTNEYVIINKTTIQKRIEELKERQKEFRLENTNKCRTNKVRWRNRANAAVMILLAGVSPKTISRVNQFSIILQVQILS